MGPFSAVYFTWKNNVVATKNPDIGDEMYWILALGMFYFINDVIAVKYSSLHL
jgi:hypothetical protein